MSRFAVGRSVDVAASCGIGAHGVIVIRGVEQVLYEDMEHSSTNSREKKRSLATTFTSSKETTVKKPKTVNYNTRGKGMKMLCAGYGKGRRTPKSCRN